MSDNGEMYRMALGSLIAVGEAAGVRPEDQLNGAAEIIEAIEAIKARRDSWRRRAELAEAALAAQGQASAADESADFEKWRSEQIASLQRMGYPDAARAFRSLGSVMWGGWQARAIRAALPAAEQPEKLLARPAKVGAVLFHAGVPEREVIECAQWHYMYEQAPPFGDDQIAGLAQALGAAKQSDAVKAPRELLELAAKAAGLTVDRYSECGLYIYTSTLGKWWSPLMDDGDARRLGLELMSVIDAMGDGEALQFAAKLKMSVCAHAAHDVMTNACRRRAITRAAAEIGRGAE